MAASESSPALLLPPTACQLVKPQLPFAAGAVDKPELGTGRSWRQKWRQAEVLFRFLKYLYSGYKLVLLAAFSFTA